MTPSPTMAVLERILPSSGEAVTTAFSFINLVILVALGLFGYFSVSIYTTWRRLRHIPGPRSAGISKWWMLRNTLGGSMHLALKMACDTYGKRRLTTNPTPSPRAPPPETPRQDIQVITLTRLKCLESLKNVAQKNKGKRRGRRRRGRKRITSSRRRKRRKKGEVKRRH